VKRTYQVLIAVDNSQSMQLIGAAEYAREALTMIWKALAQLEVGDVGVIKFGDKHGPLLPCLRVQRYLIH
jgi:midasin (ATPase involved in ribosome maturation)